MATLMALREGIKRLNIPHQYPRKTAPIKPSRTARKSVSQPTSILQPTLQADAYRSVTKAFCAVQASRRLRAAFLNCWGSCTPLAYFFLLLKKSKSPKASEAINEAIRPNVLDQHRMIPTERLFLIHS